jgi:hypothetical protein
MSSALRLVVSGRRALTCQTIKLTEKATARAAAIKALVVDFKILSVLS